MLSELESSESRIHQTYRIREYFNPYMDEFQQNPIN